MMRIFELAKVLEGSTYIKETSITENDLLNSKEVMMVGTTLDVLPVTSYEGKAISDGKVGPWAIKLNQVLKEDQAKNN